MKAHAGPTTILFTDIEGSTKLWETQPDAMSRALKRHDALARQAVEKHSGVVVKMIGDGLYAAFADPMDGVEAIVELQQALADPAATEGVPIKIRCGLHMGEVEQRDNDFFGPPVNRSARIMGAAHGGQILLSQAVVDSVGARLPSEIVLRDLGGIRLKDLASPERVYQVVHPSLRQDFPALRSLEATPNNLPQQLTAFFGRERELREAGELLKTARLVTLLGMGGLGKTRLSLQLAADALDAFPDGAWFIDLAPIQDASLVPSVVAQELSVQEEPGRPLTDTLIAHLKSRSLLVILDNCEHLVGACAKLANSVLRAATGVRILATSREPLHVPGEQTYPILPLPLPARNADVDALLKSDAVQLFLDRVRTHKPAFEFTEREAPAVAEIVGRLEGIPLALELAAARIRALSLADINTRLRDRFKLLTGGGKVLMERQQTLRALVSWSYDLLNEEEQVLFDRLCVFAGGWDLEAAEKVCGAEPLSADDVLDLLASLVDKSLVMAEESDDGTRYRALETIRDYAREKLAARGDAEATAARHCDHYLLIAKAGNKGIQGPEQPQWMRRLEAELDNLRTAIALALDGKVDPVIAVKFQVALMNFWIFSGYVSEARKLVQEALTRSEVTALPHVHAHALYVGSALSASQSAYAAAQTMLEQCLELRRTIGNPVDIAATLSTLAHVQVRMGRVEAAQASEEEALRLFREAGDRIGEAIGLLQLGHIEVEADALTAAREHLCDACAIARELRHCEIEAECERTLGELALLDGDGARARRGFARSLELCREVGDKRDEAISLRCLARVDLDEGRHAEARQGLDAALDGFLAFEMHEEATTALEDYARLALQGGAEADAALLACACASQRERLGIIRARMDEGRWQATIARLGVPCEKEAALQAGAWTMHEAAQRARAASIPGAASVARPEGAVALQA